jgi:hypothetical protein
MKARFNQVPLYVTLSLLSGLMGGCNLLGGGGSGDVAVQQSPQPNASQPFPSPSVPATISSPSKIALTRPTNPDDRLRVIKSGRTDPFGLLVPATTAGSNTSDKSASENPSNKTTIAINSKTKAAPQQQVGDRPVSSYDTFLRGLSSGLTKPSASGTKPSASGANSGSVTLPDLPAKPELSGVKVTGVIQVAGSPRAIIQAPGEPASRTVSIGDSLSNGQLYVKNIDMGNLAEPVVIFQQGDLEFAVAVGRDPVLVASAGPSAKPARGLRLAKPRP